MSKASVPKCSWSWRQERLDCRRQEHAGRRRIIERDFHEAIIETDGVGVGEWHNFAAVLEAGRRPAVIYRWRGPDTERLLLVKQRGSRWKSQVVDSNCPSRPEWALLCSGADGRLILVAGRAGESQGWVRVYRRWDDFASGS